MSLLIRFSLALFLISLGYAQDDGNPHHWDRLRRCDQDYAIPCGPCEGIGGIPYGDENKQITLTTCNVIATPAQLPESSLPAPVWGTSFSLSDKGYREVLIGRKQDPFCFEVFPGPNSEGALCYRHEEGTLLYDMDQGGPRALQLNLNVQPKGSPLVKNVTSTVVHQGQHMWIANNLWFGVDLCLCFIAVPDVFKDVRIRPHIYPVQYDWVTKAQFLGRVEIGVEFLWRTMVLDHYIIGPHHFFTDPSDGHVIRMWQPFNGLEVLDPATRGPVDRSQFTIPPEMCKKSSLDFHPKFRINCDDNGYPLPCSNATYHNKYCTDNATKSDTPTSSDLRRALQRIPGHDFTGEHAAHSWSVLNEHLKRQYPSKSLKACSEWTPEELHEIQLQILSASHPEFNSIYAKRGDKREIRHTQFEQMLYDWNRFNNMAREHERVYDMHRDGICAETVMWFVHHLTDSAKKSLIQRNTMIPLLAERTHQCPDKATLHEKAICSTYHSKVVCATCHSAVYPSSSVAMA